MNAHLRVVESLSGGEDVEGSGPVHPTILNDDLGVGAHGPDGSGGSK